MSKSKSGFTIVELLIVIVVIGILAAITIVAYNGIQGRAYNSTVQSDLTAISKKLQMAKIDSTTGQYPSIAELVSDKLSASKSAYNITGRNNLYYCPSTDGQSFAVGAVSKSGQGYVVTESGIELHGDIWGSTTCTKISAPAGNARSGYDDPTKAWASWVK